MKPETSQQQVQQPSGRHAGRTTGLGSRLAARFAGIGLDRDLPEFGQPARPAELGELPPPTAAISRR
jgi:hypothetical protein